MTLSAVYFDGTSNFIESATFFEDGYGYESYSQDEIEEIETLFTGSFSECEAWMETNQQP